MSFAKDKFKDKTQLDQDEINKILFKNPINNQNIKQIKDKQHEEHPLYDRNIESILQNLKPSTQPIEIQQEQPKQQNKGVQVITVIDKREQIQEVKYMKYGLPIPNLRPSVEDYSMQKVKDSQPPTPTMNLFELFKLDKESPYEQYEQSCVEYLDAGQSLYGTDIMDPKYERELQVNLLGENVLPLSKINDSAYMKYIENCFSLNLSMPGTIENEHPHRFLKNLRPVEEFRNTPLIPISARQMRDFQEKVEEYHRKGFLLEIKKESIYQFLFGLGIFTIMVHMLRLVLAKEEQYGMAFQRLKHRRSGLVMDVL